MALLLLPATGWLAFSQHNPLAQSIKRGEAVFNATCKNCHQQNGQGLPGVYPPLAQSDFLAANTQKVIDIVVHGLNGEITVNGKVYNLDMPAQTQLTDEQVADVLNFVRNSWGNKGKMVTIAQVKAGRK